MATGDGEASMHQSRQPNRNERTEQISRFIRLHCRRIYRIHGSLVGIFECTAAASSGYFGLVFGTRNRTAVRDSYARSQFLSRSTRRCDRRRTIVLTFVFVLVLGGIEFLLLFYQWNAAAKAVQVGARLAAVSDPVAAGLNGLGAAVVTAAVGKGLFANLAMNEVIYAENPH